MKKKNIKNILYIIMSFICFSFSFIYARSFSNNAVEAGHNSILKYVFIALAIIYIVMTYFIIVSEKKNIKEEKMFLIFAVILGIAYSLIMPIWSVPDEPHHFYRSYEISTGKFISIRNKNEAGNYLPDNIDKVMPTDVQNITYKEIKDNMNVRFSRNKKFYNFANTSLYSFVCYIPQSIGTFIGRIFNLPIIITAYI